jgi:hypothetical protein
MLKFIDDVAMKLRSDENLEGYGYTLATRWLFAEKLEQHLGIKRVT